MTTVLTTTIITTTPMINVTNCKRLTVESGVKGLPVAIGDRGGLVSSPFLSPSIVHTHQFNLQHDKKSDVKRKKEKETKPIETLSRAPPTGTPLYFGGDSPVGASAGKTAVGPCRAR